MIDPLMPAFNQAFPDIAVESEPMPMTIYACVNERSALNAKVRAFIEFLEASL